MSAGEWIPLTSEEALSLIGEGIHTGLRKGSDAPESGPLWKAINESGTAWSDALTFLVEGFELMNVALCWKERA